MSASYTYRRLSKDDAAVLLVDHQAGLISLVQDFSVHGASWEHQCLG
jgi:nicotinamidase-related amidase